VREHVQARADAARRELGDQRLLVDDLAARRIDQAGTGAEECEPPSVEQASCVGREREVEGNDVRLGDQLVERDPLAPARGEHTHVEAFGAAGDGLADPPEADDPERRARHLLREKAVGPRAVPLPGAHAPVALDDEAAHRQDQCPREVGHRRVEHTGCVRHRDPACAQRVDSDPVVAHAEVRDESQ
jgi:hypothetical protein